MELPRRERGDELLRPGALTDLRRRLRAVSARHAGGVTTVIACAFDHRTRMLPFIYADTRMVPAGVRAVGSALVDAGFPKTRIVLQQWNRSFRPSRMRLDGRVPDVFMVSTMGMHSARAMELIDDARRIEPARRPLIIAGGSHAVYEPHLLFSGDPAAPGGADVAVTGEEAGALAEIPGLVYPRGEQDGVVEELVDTGIQRLLGDLDELPDPVNGYRLLEPPSGSQTLAPQALAANRVRRHSPLSSLVMTFG